MRLSRTASFAFLISLTLSPNPSSAMLPSTDPADLRDLTPSVEIPLREWLSAWRKVQPKLSLQDFQKRQTRAIATPWISAKVDLSRDLKLPLYAFSPDRHRVVDPFGGLVLDRKGKEIEAGFQPDSWVGLIDRKTSQVREIVFCGTPCGFHEALWLSNDQFVIAGHGAGRAQAGCPGGHLHAPWIYLVSLSRNSITSYAGPESCSGVGSEYVIEKVKRKIPGVTF